MQSALVRPASTAVLTGSRLVLAAATFNMVLCFISTRGGLHISSAVVILFELVILGAGIFAARSRITERAVRITAVTTMLLIGLKFVNPGLDLKILHDLGIMYIFYELGMLASAQEGNRTLWIVMAIVLPIGLFELLLPSQFGTMFDVWSYYVDKGVSLRPR